MNDHHVNLEEKQNTCELDPTCEYAHPIVCTTTVKANYGNHHHVTVEEKHNTCNLDPTCQNTNHVLIASNSGLGPSMHDFSRDKSYTNHNTEMQQREDDAANNAMSNHVEKIAHVHDCYVKVMDKRNKRGAGTKCEHESKEGAATCGTRNHKITSYGRMDGCEIRSDESCELAEIIENMMAGDKQNGTNVIQNKTWIAGRGPNVQGEVSKSP